MFLQKGIPWFGLLCSQPLFFLLICALSRIILLSTYLNLIVFLEIFIDRENCKKKIQKKPYDSPGNHTETLDFYRANFRVILKDILLTLVILQVRPIENSDTLGFGIC